METRRDSETHASCYQTRSDLVCPSCGWNWGNGENIRLKEHSDYVLSPEVSKSYIGKRLTSDRNDCQEGELFWE